MSPSQGLKCNCSVVVYTENTNESHFLFKSFIAILLKHRSLTWEDHRTKVIDLMRHPIMHGKKHFLPKVE